ncbi:MAG: type II secretion system F family protein, partial [Phycisphaerales bacterium]
SAPDERTARKALKDKGVVVLDLRRADGSARAKRGAGEAAVAKGGGLLGRLPKQRASWRRTRAEVFAQLALLINAGMALDAALANVTPIAKREDDRASLEKMARDVREGRSLAEAMRDQPDRYDESHVGLAQAGQDSGKLPMVLRQLNAQDERADRLRDQLISSLMYPSILLFVLLLTVAGIVSFVVPRISSMFEEMEIQMPLFSRVVIAIARFCADYGVIFLVLLLLGSIAVRLQWRKPDKRRAMERWLMSLGLIGPMWWKHQAAMFSGAMAMMLRSGLPMLRSLEIGRSAWGSMEMRARLDAVMTDVREGVRLSEAAERHALLPDRTEKLLAVGEESGGLPEVFDRMAEAFEGEVSSRLKRALTLVEPIAIVAVGVLAGTLVIALLLAVFSMNDLQTM